MKFIIFVFVAILAVARAQFGFGGFGHYQGFAGGIDTPAQGARDARANTGPVVFPQAPSDSGETSGVVVGASGYGFVPPNSPSTRAHYSFY